MGDRIFHIATRADWEEALRTGTYITSTAGRTLAQEGFIHACRREQVGGVFDRYYRSLRVPLVLLTIDPSRLEGVDLRVEAVGEDTYPHLYGPLARKAVVNAVPLNRGGGIESFASIFIKEMGVRMGAALLIMLLLSGMAVGGVLVWWLARRRTR